MIKINFEKIIIDDYFNNIKNLCLSRIKFILLLFDVLERKKLESELISFKDDLFAHKKTIVNLILDKKHAIPDNDTFSTLNNINLCRKEVIDNINEIKEFLLLLNEKVLSVIIKSVPSQLIKLEKGIESRTLKNKISFLDIKVIVDIIFDYDKFSKDESKKLYNAYKLAKNLKINVCPYCNRNYIFTVIKDDQNHIIRPDFDHFFPQSNHPLLALSFYNLIPSCSICNSRIKMGTELPYDEYIHPYDFEFGNDASFDFDFNQVPDEDESFFENFTIKITVNPKSSNYNKILNSKEFFKLELIYQEHADIVGEIYIKTRKHNRFHFENILNIHDFKNTSISEFYRFYFSNYYEEDDFNKRVLSKLTKDIVNKLNIF